MNVVLLMSARDGLLVYWFYGFLWSKAERDVIRSFVILFRNSPFRKYLRTFTI